MGLNIASGQTVSYCSHLDDNAAAWGATQFSTTEPEEPFSRLPSPFGLSCTPRLPLYAIKGDAMGPFRTSSLDNLQFTEQTHTHTYTFVHIKHIDLGALFPLSPLL
jgi:hypothetical protein